MISLNKTFLPTQTYENRIWFVSESKSKKLKRLAKKIIDFLKDILKPDKVYPIPIAID